MPSKKFLLTMHYNEYGLMQLYLDHYSQYFHPENIYIIDHGSDNNIIPPQFNRIFMPREKVFSETNRLDFIKDMASSLLRYYDVGIYTDIDELIYLKDFNFELSQLHYPIYVLGFECAIFNVNNKQRLLGILSPYSCKPLIFNRVPDWTVGFHSSKNSTPPELVQTPMAHLKYSHHDQSAVRSLIRKSLYEELSLSEKDPKTGFHWTKLDADTTEFHKKVDSRIAEKKLHKGLKPIKREVLFSINHALEKDGADHATSLTYYPIGTWREQSDIFDMTEYFPLTLKLLRPHKRDN